MGESQIQEASAAAQLTVGLSTYLHGMGYSVEQFQNEINSAVAHIKAHQ